MNFTDLKIAANQFCEEYILNRIQRIKKNITEVQGSLGSETKSSAGDKHETGRAMLQLELEKLGKQLFEAEKTHQLLCRANTSKTSISASLGSLVKTTNGTYYIAISAGNFDSNDNTIYCISANTPIGKLLLGKTKYEAFIFNNKEYKLLEVS